MKLNSIKKSNNSYTKSLLDLNTTFNICKSRSNIFEIGIMNLNSKLLDIISLGLKFVPSFSKIDLYTILFNFYNSLNSLNNFCSIKFFNKDKINENVSNNISSIFSTLNKKFKKQNKVLKPLYFLDNFRTEFLKNITKFSKFDDKNYSINLNSFKNLIYSLKKDNITVTSADKNIGIVLINTKLYNNLCKDHLIKDDTYKQINYNPQFELFNSTRNTLLDLNKQGHISDNLFKCIFPKIHNKKLASFRILLKLHKPNKFGVRPLVNCSNTTLSALSKTIDYYLKPIVCNHFSFIKDSQNLLQLTRDKYYDSKLKLFSADFESLYTNIPLEKSIDILMEIVSKFDFLEINSYAFYNFLKLVLLNNYFYFKHNNLYSFFIQRKGVAMGTSCGPSIANIYLSYFEIKYKNFINTSLYFRYIDDIIYTDQDNCLTNKFPFIFPDLKLNTISDSKVQFLDLNISFDHDRSLKFDLFIKPTFTGSYLNSKSNHPHYIYRGIIISLV